MKPKMALIIGVVAAVVLFPVGFFIGMNQVVSQKRAELEKWKTAQALAAQAQAQAEFEAKQEQPQVEKAETLEDFKNISEEMERWKQELNTEKLRLLKMDEDLVRREALLKVERETLDKEKEKILQMQKDLESQIIKIEESDRAGLKDIGELFAKMKVDEVVNFLRIFPEEVQLTKVMSELPKKQLVRILEHWSRTYPEDRQKILRVTNELRRVVKESKK